VHSLSHTSSEPNSKNLTYVKTIAVLRIRMIWWSCGWTTNFWKLWD